MDARGLKNILTAAMCRQKLVMSTYVQKERRPSRPHRQTDGETSGILTAGFLDFRDGEEDVSFGNMNVKAPPAYSGILSIPGRDFSKKLIHRGKKTSTQREGLPGEDVPGSSIHRIS